MTDWREELIEKMAKAAWECDTLRKWEDISKWMQEGVRWDCRAALAVAEPVVREQTGGKLREENARLREALKDADNALRMCVFEVGLNEEADGLATAHSFSRSVLDRIASGGREG